MARLSNIEKSLAVAIASTRKKKRPVDLVTLARHLKRLVREYGSPAKVGEMIGISGRMVEQLMLSGKCSEQLKDLIKERKIDSADAVCKIVQWADESDRVELAKQVVKRNLSSTDVRAIVKLRIDNPRLSVRGAIKRVLDSKDRKTFTVLLFLDNQQGTSLDDKILESLLRQAFKRVVRRGNLLSFELRRPAMLVQVTPAGMKLLKQKAKDLGIPLANLANAVLEEAVLRKKRRRQHAVRNK